MANNKSNYLEQKVIEYTLGKTAAAFTVTPVWMALCLSGPAEADTGSSLSEATYSGYVRCGISASQLSTAVTSADGGMVVSNVLVLTFPPCAGSSALITGFAICDASAAGNVLYYGSVSPSKTIDINNTPPTIAVGGLAISEL